MLNQKMLDSESRDGMDAAIIVFNPLTKTVQFAGANNPMYVIHQQDLGLQPHTQPLTSVITADEWTLTEIKADKRPIGGRSTQQQDVFHYTLHEFVCEEKAHLYLFTDGFIDQIGGADRKKIMSRGLKQLLMKHHTLPFEQQRGELSTFFEDWLRTSKRQLDDVLVWGMEINSQK